MPYTKASVFICLDIKNIKTFIRVSELNSFTNAAKELNYVQSTVTSQIQQLESELGFPLFDRIGKSVSLTSMGKEFLIRAYEIVHIIEDVQSLGKKDDEISGVLRVGVLESLLLNKVTNILTKFKDTYKNITLIIKMGESDELIHMLKRNELDIIYLSTENDTEEDIKCCYKNEEEIIFVSSIDHPLAKKEEIMLQELFNYSFVLTEKNGICHKRLLKTVAENDLTLNYSIEVDSTAAVALAVEKGLGIAFLPKYSVEHLIKEKKLKHLNVQIEKQTYFSRVLRHKGRWFSPVMQNFISLIKEFEK